MLFTQIMIARCDNLSSVSNLKSSLHKPNKDTAVFSLALSAERPRLPLLSEIYITMMAATNMGAWIKSRRKNNHDLNINLDNTIVDVFNDLFIKEN
ncbi:hypothetical protein Syun_005864 [Stephania yunnanensis]|uniref:Uncharacterized protein n=1 Tax=Stephania yunnanensis TaxID=152371 RepID=A0AAP0KVJ8_9MAGN